jgi:hypothetical protein
MKEMFASAFSSGMAIVKIFWHQNTQMLCVHPTLGLLL